MTLDPIDRMVRQANPVPDPTALEPVDASVLVLDQQRRTEMQTNDRVKVDPKQKKPRPGLLIGIAAAVGVIAVGVLILVQPGDQPVTTEAPETLVARDFLEAYTSFDAEEAASYLAADFFSLGWGGKDWRFINRLNEAQGYRWLIDPCEVTETSPSGTVVRCPFDYHAFGSDQLGLGPFTGNWYDVTVLDGEIVDVDLHLEFMSNGFSAQMWEPFALWVAENHPDDVTVMYADSTQTLEALTEESIQLWEQHRQGYVEDVRP